VLYEGTVDNINVCFVCGFVYLHIASLAKVKSN